MRIHGLCLVRNEIDVIEESLRDATRWCDWIYVLDNGSDDGTWERVQSLATEAEQIVPFRQDGRPFYSGMRQDILRHFVSRGKPNDWWCLLDADEFYLDDPRAILPDVPPRFDVVYKQELTYFFTDEDLDAYRLDPTRFSAQVPVTERLRYYRADWSEIRFFRHPRGEPEIPWSSTRVYPRRVRVKHFQYRSPEQIQKRLEVRRAAMERGSFPHEKRDNWRAGSVGECVIPGAARADQIPTSWEERVVPTAGLHFDTRDGTYAAGAPWSPPRSVDADPSGSASIGAVRKSVKGRARNFVAKLWRGRK